MNRARIVSLIQKTLAGRQPRVALAGSRCRPLPPEAERLRLTPAHWCYLRISEGCSQRCTFCSIPCIRGPYRSKPMDQILEEARTMIASGAREIILIGQETTNYGKDLGYKNGLAKLLTWLDRLRGIDWIRLMYTYPGQLFRCRRSRPSRELEHVVKYIDIPLQHINDRILKRMGRRIDRERNDRSARQAAVGRIPELTLRTTLIVGFPGETDAEFQELYDFVRAY